jgi:hypothetical protein
MPRAARNLRNFDAVQGLYPLGHPMAEIVPVPQQPTAVGPVAPRE